MWTRWPGKPKTSPAIGSVVFTPYAQYYVDEVRSLGGESWCFRRVVLSALAKAVLTLLALAVILVGLALVSPERPRARALDCPQGGCIGRASTEEPHADI